MLTSDSDDITSPCEQLTYICVFVLCSMMPGAMPMRGTGPRGGRMGPMGRGDYGKSLPYHPHRPGTYIITILVIINTYM